MNIFELTHHFDTGNQIWGAPAAADMDNDGLIDANGPVQEDSWFWPHLRRDLDYFSLEVYGATPAELASQVQLVERRLARFE